MRLIRSRIVYSYVLDIISKTMVKAIILMRHAEREDRAAEMKGIDWISTAARPQDPLLSEEGMEFSV